MGNLESKVVIPRGHASEDEVAGQRIRFGSAGVQGRRPYMEDCLTATFARKRDDGNELALFAVFDGHGGSRVAEFCTDNMASYFLRRMQGLERLDGLSDEDMDDQLSDVFMEMDAAVSRLPPVLVRVPPSCSCLGREREVYRDISMVGSTASTVWVTRSQLVFAHAGDSRAMLVRDGKLAFVTRDHTPEDPLELDRIQNAGAIVLNARVDGILAVARALGDDRFKRNDDVPAILQAVTARPEVTALPRSAGDQLLLLASDGVWSVMSNAEVCEFASRFLLDDDTELDIFCELLLDEVVNRRYSSDNACVLVVDLRGSLRAASSSAARPAQPAAVSAADVSADVGGAPARKSANAGSEGIDVREPDEPRSAA